MNGITDSTKWPRRIGQGLTELLFFMPVWLTLGVYFVPATIMLPWAVSLLVLYMASGAVAERRSSMRVVIRLLISLLLAMAAGAVLGVMGNALTDYKFWIVSAICGVCAAEQGSALFRKGWRESFRSAHMGFGVLGYGIAIPFSYWFLDELATFRLWMAACGMAAVILFLHIVNARHLMNESVDGSQSKTLTDAYRRNRVLLGGLTVLMVIFAAFRHIQQWIEDNILAALKKLLSMIGKGGSEELPPEQPAPPAAPEMFPPMEPSEPSRLLVWLEHIMRFAVTVAIVIGALFLLYWLGRRFGALFRQWMDKLLKRQSIQGKDDSAYTDEVERLMTLSKWRERFKTPFKSSRGDGTESEPAWDKLTSGKERMRWLYRQWLREGIRQGYKPQPHLTAKETADSMADWRNNEASRSENLDFVGGYEAVRYGDMNLNEEQLASYRRWVERQAASKRMTPGKRD